MTTPRVESGNLEPTERSLQQDAQEAMGGNIVRGLVELITNADDAYARLDRGRGRIRVEVEHRRGHPWRVVVRDRATGITEGEIHEKLITLGRRTSGFEQGLAVRGNLGRGAKDLIAFGPVTFETISDDEYSRFVIEHTGHWELTRKPATPADRQRLGIPGNGTVVDLVVSSSIGCPLHENLAVQLSNHYALRDIMSDPDREITLVNLNNGESRRLICGITHDGLEAVFNGPIRVPDYPRADVHLQIWRLAERCERPRSDETRPCGILLKGRRAIYDNTLFRFEGNPHAGWFTGRLACTYIEELARGYDDRLEHGQGQTPENPIPIITRRRDGLAPNHPFTRALSSAVDRVLADLVRDEQERERRASPQIANEDTRRALQRAEQVAARFLQEALREIEVEEPPTGLEGHVEPLEIVPPEAVILIGEQRTLSLLGQAGGLQEGASVMMNVEPQGVVELVDGSSLPLSAHRRRSDVLAGQLRVRGLVEGEALITAGVQQREAVALITVEPSPGELPPPEEPPESLVFERPRYRVALNKRKRLILKAPAASVEAHGDLVHIRSDESMAVVIVGGGQVRLRTEATGIAVGTVQVEGRRLGASVAVRARLGSQEATCRVNVVQRDEGLPNLWPDIVGETPGIWRAVFDPPFDTEPAPGQRRMLKIYGLHPALRPYLGAPPDYVSQNTPECLAVLAEVFSEVIVRQIVTAKYERRGAEPSEPLDIYVDHFTYMTRLLPRIQEALRQRGPLD